MIGQFCAPNMKKAVAFCLFSFFLFPSVSRNTTGCGSPPTPSHPHCCHTHTHTPPSTKNRFVILAAAFLLAFRCTRRLVLGKKVTREAFSFPQVPQSRRAFIHSSLPPSQAPLRPNRCVYVRRLPPSSTRGANLMLVELTSFSVGDLQTLVSLSSADSIANQTSLLSASRSQPQATPARPARLPSACHGALH